ncbi:MAG: 5-(carboxyamino)imidazole ribonucleotide mutase [Eubacteriales bacterium]|nr:5-(carboxyamino)imidazole ribonucleotide mutase [Eubacteriales bacterium]
MAKRVLVVMGSDSDFPVMEACFKTLKDFDVDFEATVCSAHRTPERAAQLARSAADQDFGVIIAAAGLAAHLPGVLAAFTVLPVIGVPIKTGALNGQDALYAIVQMPSGIPVATVAIDGAANAAILAVQMLSLGDSSLIDKLKHHKLTLEKTVLERDRKLQAKLAQL